MENPGARLKFPVHSWFGAETFWHRSRSPHKLANNTYVEKLDDKQFGVKLHDTLIVVYSLDGTIKLDSGGYRTTTTKARINELLPPGYRVWQEKFEWFVTVPAAEEPREFSDGMLLDVEHGNPHTENHPHKLTKEQALDELAETRQLSTAMLEPLGIPFEAFLAFSQKSAETQEQLVDVLLRDKQNAPTDVIAMVNPDFPVTDFFRADNAGQWIDGALGEAHARMKMRNMLDQLVARAATEDQVEVLERLITELDQGDPGDDLNETLNESTDVLDWFTADGYVWDWEAGNLVLIPIEELDELPM